MKNSGLILTLVAIIAGLVFFSAYTVDETEQVVITQLGKVIGEPVTESGLKFRIPFIQQVRVFPKNLQVWDGERGEIPTKNKTYIWVDVFARWRITDPIVFLETCNSVPLALSRIGDIIDPAVKNAIASYDLIETVRNTNREFDYELSDVAELRDREERVSYTISVGRKKITEQIQEHAKVKLEAFGIELVDVKIKRVNYRDDVRNSVYDRMIAERTQIVEKFRSEGRGEAQKIKGDKEKELKRITSEAYKKAQMVMGEADAKVTKIYADAYGKDPEFYSFVKSLEMYEKAVDKDSLIILSTDSEFFKYVNGRK